MAALNAPRHTCWFSWRISTKVDSGLFLAVTVFRGRDVCGEANVTWPNFENPRLKRKLFFVVEKIKGYNYFVISFFFYLTLKQTFFCFISKFTG